MANITHFGKYYYPDNGGIETVTRSLAVGAFAHGHKVTVVCFGDVSACGEESIDGVHVVRMPKDLVIASQPIGLKYFWRSLRAAMTSDVVHVHIPNMLAAFCVLLIRRRTKVVVHWHSDIIGKRWIGPLFRPLEMALLWRADVVVSTSLAYADASETLAFFRKKVTAIPIGVSGAVTLIDDTDITTAFDERIAGRKIVLAVGRLVPYKGFDILVRAAKNLGRDVVVVLVGDGPMHNDLCNLVNELKLTKNVLLTGRQSDEVLNMLFRRACLFCLPSVTRAEAFGVVLLEAMSYGLPIVATDIVGSGVSWVNQHGITGLNVPVNDPDALAEACNQILNSEELQASLSKAAHDRFLSEFTEEIFVDRMMKVYDRLLA